MPFVRQVVAVSCVVFVTLLGGCAGKASLSDDTAAIRQQLRKPLSSEARAKLLQPQQLSSIGQAVRLDGLEPLQVAGLGLVAGLFGAGANKGNIDPRNLADIKKTLIIEEGRTLEEAKILVESVDSSVVQAVGSIPAGAPAGALFDVYIQSVDAAVSLDNGMLHKTPLRTYVVTDQGPVAGQIVARAAGSVTTGVSEQAGILASTGNKRAGIVFDGGRTESERILLLFLHPKLASASRAVLIEYLLNMRFSGVARQPGLPSANYAAAVAPRLVQLRIPDVYRRYVERFADVVKSIRGSYFYGPPSAGEMEKMAERLVSGSRAEKYAASTDLEAVGQPAVPHLESALDKGDDWSSLYAAQALCYLESQRGPDRIFQLANSSDEGVRFEAVRFTAQLAGRRPIQALRERVYDPSDRIAVEAVKGLIALGPQAASQIRLSQFDLVAVPGAEPGLIVKSGGRPMVIVLAPGTPLQGAIAITLPDVGIGSAEDPVSVAISIGRGPDIKTTEVEATADNILVTLSRENPPFELITSAIHSLEDARNTPYKIRYID